jgi:hypothetical protein
MKSSKPRPPETRSSLIARLAVRVRPGAYVRLLANWAPQRQRRSRTQIEWGARVRAIGWPGRAYGDDTYCVVAGSQWKSVPTRGGLGVLSGLSISAWTWPYFGPSSD